MNHVRSALGALAAACLLAAAPSAHAANRFTLDAHPASPGHVLLNPPGSAPGSVLVAWTSTAPSGDLAPIPKVCVVASGQSTCTPQILHAPEGDGQNAAINGLFPIVNGSTVTLVGPRDATTDVVTWSSVGGGPFGAPQRIRGTSPNLTNPDDVLANGLIGARNPTLGIGDFGAERGEFTFRHPGADVASSSLALDANGRPVDAYFTLDDVVHVFRYAGAGNLTDNSSWTGPITVADGDEPVLTGGASGLFLADVEGTSLMLRRDDGNAFAPAKVLSNDPGTELFDAGAATQAPGGRLAVLWPRTRTDGSKVMRLFASTDGGANFTQSDVATLGDSYLDHRNASAAVGDDGQGAVTYVDEDGLQLADFNPLTPVIPPPAPPAPPVVTPPAPPRVLVFDPLHGPFNLTGFTLGRDEVTLATPRGCVRGGDVVMRIKVRTHRHGLRVTKVRFKADGKLVRTRTKAPFSTLFRVKAAPGTWHELRAQVFITSAHGARITRTLRNAFQACSA